MTNIHSNRTLRYYIKVLIAILMPFLILYHSDLSAKEKASGFVFNPKSEYWPTNGWKTSTPEKQGMSSEILTEIFEDIENRDLSIDSLMVVRNGYIVVEANKRHFETLYPIYSSTKSFTSAIIGIALSKGHIKSVDQKISNFYPELLQKNGDSKIASITLKHLLTMSCGFEWPEIQTDYSNIENPVFQMVMSENWVNFLFNKPVTQEPGLEWNYNSGCSHLLFAVLYKTGLDVADFAQKYLFTPLGISNDQYKWRQDSNGMLNGSHDLYMSPRGMAKFGYLYLKGGHWDGEQIIPKSWIEESTKNHMKMNWKLFDADHYGYKWYIQSFGFHSAGYKGQYIFVIPKFELVVVFTSDLIRQELGEPIDLVKNYIVPAADASKPLPENQKAITILNSKIERFIGN
jgi:CubicO group peptidase (beta-lactamase class C family)